MCAREQVYGVDCLNLVGGATSAVEYAGPTISEAAECVSKNGMVRPLDGPSDAPERRVTCVRQVPRGLGAWNDRPGGVAGRCSAG